MHCSYCQAVYCGSVRVLRSVIFVIVVKYFDSIFSDWMEHDEFCFIDIDGHLVCTKPFCQVIELIIYQCNYIIKVGIACCTCGIISEL